jgi:ELWxxDGT repeat protein
MGGKHLPSQIYVARAVYDGILTAVTSVGPVSHAEAEEKIMSHRTMSAIAERLEPRRMLSSAILVSDIIPGADTSVSLGTNQYAAVGSKLFVAAVDATHGEELWVTDGTAAGTHLTKDIDPTSHPLHVTQLTAGNGVVYFVANDGSQQIWQSDGTEAGTKKISSLTAADGSPFYLTFVNNSLVFFTGVSTSPGIYRLNSTGGQTKIANGSIGGFLHQVVGNKLFYGAAQGSAADISLWTTDGNSAQVVAKIKYMGQTAGALGNQLIFDGSTDTVASEPWHSGGTSATTSLLKDINPTAGSFPTNFTTVGSFTYFIADSGPTDGFQIYRTDGAAVSRVTKLAGTTFGVLRDLTNFNGTLFFTYVKPTQKRLLYKFDGTNLAQVGATAGPTNPGYLTPVGKSLFFSALDTAGAARLFQTDGTTISAVTGDAGTDPASLINVNGTLYFQATDPAHGGELRAVPGDAVGGGSSAFTVHLKASKTTLDEGGSVVFEAVTSPKGKFQYRWDFDGDGKLTTSGYKPTHLYDDNLKDNAPRRVRVKVIAADGTFKNAYIDVTVNNVKPQIKVLMPPAYATIAPMPCVVTVIDPGKRDKHSITINWDDRSTDNYKVDGPGAFSFVHIWTTRQLLGRRVEVTVRDKDGAKKSKKQTVFVDNLLDPVITDPANIALGIKNIIFGGTNSSDKMEVKRAPKSQQLTSKGEALYFFLNGLRVGRFLLDKDDVIYAMLGGGEDFFNVGPSVKSTIVAHGGKGNDQATQQNAAPFSFFGDAGTDKAIGLGPKSKFKQ